MGVYELVVGHPEGVAYALHALEVVYVAGGHHELYVYGFGHFPHGLGHCLLVVVAVAAEVVGKVEVQGLLQGLPFGAVV